LSERENVGRLVGSALASLERSRQRIDDLNVYPVPDGDTGTNLVLTTRALSEALEASKAETRTELAEEATRAALMGARGNSGVILSQIVRGAAEVLGAAQVVDVATLAAALRGASDAAYRAVRRPVEGTMLTVVRELAEEAESRVGADLSVWLEAVLRRGEDAVARTPEQLAVLREAGVVDAGAAGLVELVRGLVSAVTGEELPESPPAEELGFEAIHQELSRFRYCTVFVVEGEGLDGDALEAELERLGDSLLVVGDARMLKAHVHTDDPGSALSVGARLGMLEGIEIANMHRQTRAREERLLEVVPDLAERPTEVVAVAAGDGNRRILESLGAARVVEGGQSMNPSTAEILTAIESLPAGEVIVLPNNSNVVLSAEQAAALAERPVHVLHTESVQAGIAAMVAFDPSRPAAENLAEMEEAVAAVATGAVTVASRDVELNGFAIVRGAYLGLADGEAVAGGASFDEVARAVVERLLAEPRSVLMLLTGEEKPPLDGLLAFIEANHPSLEFEVHEGGQPHYPLWLSAE
jgi:DAK2 domain fusion protein YloV